MKNHISIVGSIAKKKYCVLFSILFALNNVFGGIKNGYENAISGMRESLKS